MGSGDDKLKAYKQKQAERNKNSKPGTVWSRPDSNGDRVDVTAESKRLSQQRKEERLQQKLQDSPTGPNIHIDGPGGVRPSGKEYVFEFSNPISSKAAKYVSKLVALLGGKKAYIEDQTKLVVVM